VKLLYTTDLHGNRRKYELLFKKALAFSADIVINGGDLLPNTGDPRSQGEFIEGFLEELFRGFEKEKIYYLSCPGNDDLKIFDEKYSRVCARFSYVKLLMREKADIFGYEFIGMDRVSDYPFRLKDRCRKDAAGSRPGRQFGSGVLSTERGFKIIDWGSRFRKLPALEDELANLPPPEDPKKAVYVIHMPPANLGLDLCLSGDRVGSGAVYRFLKEKQPLMSLHGHIHESPMLSGRWQASLGRTACIQPGQGGDFSYVLIDLEKMHWEKKDDLL